MSKPNPPLPPAEKTLTADPDFFTLRGSCQMICGRHVFGAEQMELNLSYTGMTALAMLGRRDSLYVKFTPDGLRQLASHLLDAAAKAEAIGAEHARTQLAASRDMLPDDPAYTEDYPVDWPDAPLTTPSDADLAASEAQADAADRMWSRIMAAWLFFGFCLLAAIITSAAR